MENVNELFNALLKLIIAVAVIAIPILCKPLFEKLAKAIEAKIGKIDSEKKEKIFNASVKFLTALVNTTVAYLEQEFAKEIREGVIAGQVDRSELFALKDKAIKIIKLQISDTIKEVLETRIADVDSYIDNLVSEAVLKLKENMSVATLSITQD